jgi:hypothetical protein
VVIDNLELTNIAFIINTISKNEPTTVQNKYTILLHDLQEFNHNLGGRSDQDLSLSTLFSVGDSLEDISQNGHSCHLKSEPNVNYYTQN